MKTETLTTWSMSELKWQQMVHELLASLLPHQRSILGLLAINDHVNQNPAQGLSMLGCELPGKLGFDLIDLANSLETGNELFKTLEQYPKLVPPQAVFLLKIAQAEGILPYVYQQIRQRYPRINSSSEFRNGAGFGLLLKILFVLGVIGFLILKIIPEMAKIFEEFRVESAYLALLVQYSDAILGAFGIFLALLLLLALLWITSRMLKLYFGHRPWQVSGPSRVVTRWRFLASLAQTGAIANLIEHNASSTALKRLLPRLNGLRNRMLEGQNLWAAMADKHLLPRVDANLVSLASPETQAWLLRWKALQRERRILARWHFGGRLTWILAQSVMFGLVILACLLIFGSMIALLNSLSQW